MAVVPDAVGIVVKDMGRALAFYRLLGLEFPPGSEREPHVEANVNGFRIMFDTVDLVREIYGHWREPVGHRMSLAFKCETPGEVDAVYAAIVAAGHKGVKKPWNAFWGQRYAVVADPDGNHVDIFC